MDSNLCEDAEAPLAPWHLKRLRCLSAGPRLYGRWDTVNAFLVTRGLVTLTTLGAGAHKREFALTEAGQRVLRRAQVDFIDRRRR